MPDPTIYGCDGVSPDDARWWRWWRITLALTLSVTIAVVAFAFRFNSLGGVFGGIDDDHFATLMRVDLLLDGQQPLRDFADFELRGAWPSLSYVLPAWAQRIGGRSLLPEAYLTVGALALTNALLFTVALALSRRWSVGLLAAAFAIATTPRLYNYPKVLMLALGALAIRAIALRPSALRLALAALITALAVLFRHDYGVYIAAGTLAALAGCGDGWRSVTTRIGTYVGMTAVFLLPSAVWVQTYEGIPSYIGKIARTAMLEAQRTELRLPGVIAPVSEVSDVVVMFTYYAFWLVAVAAAVLVVRRNAPGRVRLSRADRATVAGLLALAVTVNLFFLRANLTQRFGDAVVPVVLLLAWTIGATSGIGSAWTRRLATGSLLCLLVLLFGASAASSGAARRFRDAGLLDEWPAPALRFQAVRDGLRQMPPADWSEMEMGGSLPAARYVAMCTSPDDYLLIAGYAPEIHVLARRRFAAGQGTVSLGFYTSDEDQRRALARLARQSVPIVLAEADSFDEGFVSDYPLLAAHVLGRYRDAGTVDLGGDARLRVFIDAARTPTGVDRYLGLPCFR